MRPVVDSYKVASGLRIECNRAGTAVRIRDVDRVWPDLACFAVAGDAHSEVRQIRRAHRLRLLRRLGLCAVAAAALALGVGLISWSRPDADAGFLMVLGTAGAVFAYGMLGGRSGHWPDLNGLGVAIPSELFDRLEAPERDKLLRLQREDSDVQMAAGQLVLTDYEKADRQARLDHEHHVQETARQMLYQQDD